MENTVSTDIQPDDFEARLKGALVEANIPTLQMLIVQLTGDESWLLPPYTMTRSRGVDDNDSGGLSEELQGEIRKGAFEAILAWHNGEPIAMPTIPADQLLRMMQVSTGEEIPEAYAHFLAAKMDSYSRPLADIPDLSAIVPDNFRVLIVGAGMSGIALGISLKRAGVPFTIVERGSEVGGTWNQHQFPGAGVDTPGHLYSFSFVRGQWDTYFPSRDEVHANYVRIAEEFGILENIVFNTEVIGARYDEAEHVWHSDLRGRDDVVTTVTTPILVSAVGAFSTPKWPDIPGLADFKGDLIHPAWWNQDVELKGKRVGVVGNGATSMQIVTAIVDDVEHLTVYQRSKQWAAPFPKLHRKIPEGAKFLFSEVPHYDWWYRLRLSWNFDSKVYDSLVVDPEWEHPERSLNAINDGHRRFFTRYIMKEIGDREDLAEKLVPDFPPYGKRMLLDHGWYRTMTRDDVELVTDPIERVDATGILNVDGTHRDLDVLITASGYDVVRFLAQLPLYGRDGVSVREAWNDDDPRAYLGTVTPGFPNFFMLFGPGTSLGHGGSFIFITECQINYILSVLEQMLADDFSAVEVRADVCTEYNDVVEKMHEKMIWKHPGMSTYYRNKAGRVVMNSPWRTSEYWEMTKHADMSDFIRTPKRASALTNRT
jgi:4-hydroxyacetophenone monooxygenase